ncbi:hypothetical protein EXIGLDRAFT_724613 [Exidia glandulosa HHB12029]|uniref:Transferase-domain-containing protein n=1 Tax=Exidia glandulosa HHB12029 TaxID=1314781 RepID=A0A165MQ75_EXIGL|nr:hypothetical protein EXIGLDRAFT_724613 [Exidia glandulosa HHB12029]
MASSVTVIAQRTVQCANFASVAAYDWPLKLGPFDHLVAPFIPVAVVYVYKALPASSAELVPVDRLHRAMERLLDYYPHQSGRLHIHESDGTREIDRVGAGASLLEARCSDPLDAFCSPEHDGRVVITSLPDGGNALLAPFDPAMDKVLNGPLLTVQHTRFACGSVALGIRLYHTLCDGGGYFQLVRHLAELYRGLGAGDATSGLACPPHIRPYLNDFHDKVTATDRQAALAFQPELLYLVDESSAVKDDAAPAVLPPPAPVVPLSPVTGRVMRFSAAELNALKEHATGPNGEWASTFEALAAHLHQRVYLARLKLPHAPTPSSLVRDYLNPINTRSRLASNDEAQGMPPGYFGNALLTTSTPMDHELLAEGAPLWRIAKVIHDLSRSPTFTDVNVLRQTIRWVAAQPDVRRVRDHFNFAPGAFMASQWNKLPTYAGADFDVDSHGAPIPPLLVAPPFTPISLVDGLGYFVATEEQFHRGVDVKSSSDIDLHLALSEPLWEILNQDPEFRRFRKP